MATCTPPKDVIHPSLLHRPSKAGAPFPVQLIRDLAPWFNQSMETAHRPRVNGILKMESVALAESLQQTEMSLQNKSLHSRGVWTNAEAKRVGNVGQCASSAETGLASGTLEVGETENANGTQSELSAISRSGGVEEDCKRFLVGKVSDTVSAYATVLNSGLRTEDMLQRRKTPFLREKNPKNEVARFNPAKLDNLEGGESPKDQSCVIMLKNRSTVECPYNDFECKRVEEISSGSYVSDAFSSAAIMDQKASAGKDNNISGFKKVVKVPFDKLLPANSNILEGVDDLVQLNYLNEPSVLHNLHNRYAQDVIYTKAGPILIAINPYKDLSVHGNDFLHAYRRKDKDIPHVYSMANGAFDAMMRDGVNQSIIISGESGAGKSETAKIAMQYLASFGGGNGVEDEILQTNSILEAFSNAKTLSNNNSSRFGKLINVHFDESGKICGAKIHTYLLEKSRVVQQAKGERSYHIFYQLCAGASTSLRERLNLRPAEEYHYLNQSDCLTINEVNDAERFRVTRGAFSAVHISPEDQENAFAMLAAVLWLGNITFSIIDNENHVRVDYNEAAKSTAKLLGCDVEELMTALSTHNICAGNENISQNLTFSQAVNIRDTLAKALYSCLFDWLIDRINKLLEAWKCETSSTISILDICGFESFDKNSFEQLCINYANERLQQHFIRHLFKLDQEEYCLEGIDWTIIEFQDNQECLDLIEKKPLGIISLLDEESSFPKGTDLTLANKFKQHLNGNSFFKCKRGKAFAICHCAGEVVYDTTGFLEKNRDLLSSNLLQLLFSCTSQLPQLFASNIHRGQKFTNTLLRTNGREPQKRTVATKFKDQLFNLMEQLENTSPHFIRCIKPNGLQLPGIYDQKLVLQQLHCCGVLEVVRKYRSCYPIQMTHEQFTKSYGVLLLQNVTAQDVLSVCTAILHKFSIPHEMYQVGFTKLFFRAGQIGRLEVIRTQTLQGILRVQKHFRGHKVRSYFKELKRVVIFLQSLVRCARERKQYQLLKERYQAAATIQKEVRRMIVRQKYMRTRTMVILVQAVIRSLLARNTAIMQQQLQVETSSLRMHIEGHIACTNMDSSKESDLMDKLLDSTQELPKANKDLEAVELKLSEEDVGPEETIRIKSSFLADLQKRLQVAEATIREKEEENAVLHQRLQHYEAQWPGYEAKMTSMEETWQTQTKSLQMTLIGPKKRLTAEGSVIHQTMQHEANLRSPVSEESARYVLSDDDDLDWEDSTSEGTKTSDSSSNPQKLPQQSDIGLEWELDADRSVVGRLVKVFECRAQGKKHHSKLLVGIKSGITPANISPEKQLKNLTRRFNVWGKGFEIRLRETNGILQKQTKKKWWRSRRG